MPITQTLLFPDPRPLVERLGSDFFRQAPRCPGVYLMRDTAGAVLYVGKAKDLRQRLRNYRVANPDRMPRRHLRLLRSVARIELQECASESAALARESELLHNLRPRFNRSGTWPGTPRYLLWRTTPAPEVQLMVGETVPTPWRAIGPLSVGAFVVQAALARLLWCAVHSARSVADLPHAWFRGRSQGVTSIALLGEAALDLGQLTSTLESLFAGQPETFAEWIRSRSQRRVHPFEAAALEADLQTLVEFGQRQQQRKGVTIEVAPLNTSQEGERCEPLTPAPSALL